MRRHIGSVITKALSLGKAYPTRLTDRDALESLFRRLRPISTDKPLVRMGPNGDGGYLVPDDLNGIEACFSPGVSTTSGFERDCADMGIKVFLADESVEKPAESHELFQFIKKYVGVTSNDTFITLDEWVGSYLPDSTGDLLLQSDIEGYEYEVFLGMSDALMRRWRIVVVEFHDLDDLWCLPYFRLASRAFEKILQTHTCVHIHPNNCCGLATRNGLSIPRVAEFTFLRHDRVINPRFTQEFPHALDHDNVDKPSIVLPAFWYKE